MALKKIKAPSTKNMEQVFQFFVEINIIQMLANTVMVRVMPHELTPSQFALLSHFSRVEDLRQSIVDLARIFQVSKPSMGETVDKLHNKGFVKIEINSMDRREKIVSLTKKGALAKIDAEKAVYPFLKSMIEKIGINQFTSAHAAINPIRIWMDSNRNI